MGFVVAVVVPVVVVVVSGVVAWSADVEGAAGLTGFFFTPQNDRSSMSCIGPNRNACTSCRRQARKRKKQRLNKRIVLQQNEICSTGTEI